MKEASANFISLNLDFSWLQENMLNDKSLANYEDAFGGDYNATNKMRLPSVHVIREESPDRCIIAEICSYLIKSKEFAELGGALSYKLYEVEKFDYFFTPGHHEYWAMVGALTAGMVPTVWPSVCLPLRPTPMNRWRTIPTTSIRA